MGLPYEVLPIGLSYCEKYLKVIISEWHIENIQNRLNEQISVLAMESADYMVIYNQLSVLVDLKNEVQIIQKVFDLLTILYAPKKSVISNSIKVLKHSLSPFRKTVRYRKKTS